MNKVQFLDKFEELIPGLLKFVRERAEYYYECGGIDPEEYEDNYRLPKNIMCAICNDLEYLYKPISAKDCKAVKNLSHF